MSGIDPAKLKHILTRCIRIDPQDGYAIRVWNLGDFENGELIPIDPAFLAFGERFVGFWPVLWRVRQVTAAQFLRVGFAEEPLGTDGS